MIYLHAITPIHSGTGQAAAIVDLPIAREKATGWPIIPASSLKGVLRDIWENNGNQSLVDKAFGRMEEAGALCFGDQRILCLPVRSFFGTFAYVTCPLALSRFVRDMQVLGATLPFDAAPSEVTNDSILLPPNSSKLAQDGKVYLEDLDLTANVDDRVKDVADGLANALFQEDATAFTSRFAVVSDEVFNFLSETAMEVTARVRLEDGVKKVVDGGLWYEEAVPAEAIFCGPVVLADYARRNDGGALLEALQDQLIQIGGKSSVGRGLCRMVVAK
jgi:CRISPR-associated protein Cmr4